MSVSLLSASDDRLGSQSVFDRLRAAGQLRARTRLSPAIVGVTDGESTSVREIIRRAIEIGERDSTIGFDELNQLCAGAILEPEDIESILSALSEAGIWIEEDRT